MNRLFLMFARKRVLFMGTTRITTKMMREIWINPHCPSGAYIADTLESEGFQVNRLTLRELKVLRLSRNRSNCDV